MTADSQSLPPAGWYPDPSDSAQERYWNGHGWSPAVRPAAQRAADDLESDDIGFGRGNQELNRAGYTPGDTGAPAYSHDASTQHSPTPWRDAEQYVSGPTTADGMPLAGWWRRVVASVIDSVLLNFVSQPVVMIFTAGMQSAVRQGLMQWEQDLQRATRLGGEIPNPLDPAYQLADYLIVSTVIVVVLQFLYGLLFLKFQGRTLGHMVLELVVVPTDEGQHSGGLSWKQAAIRHGAYVVLNFIPFVGLFNVLLPLFNKRRQTLHDMIGKTQVIRRPRELY